MIKINFKQGKYILPLVVFVPLCCLAYILSDMFDSEPQNQVATDQLNSDIPDGVLKDSKNKYAEMQMRFGKDDDAYTMIDGAGEDEMDAESLGQSYTEAELNQIDTQEGERARRELEMRELERSMAQSRRHINSYSYEDKNSSNGWNEYSSYMNQIKPEDLAEPRTVKWSVGLGKEDKEEALQKQQEDSIRKAKEIEREKNRPLMVIKSKDANSEKFNTLSSDGSDIEAPLIRAMIDQTTKAHEGTRIRFKLLDDINIRNVQLKKGTYLYGSVTGFGQQRVKANISSILIGNKFINVNLSVYDIDGMEGFYVPESAFRDFMKNAGSSIASGGSMSINNSGGTGISAEALALQALQNVYSSATSAISTNIRKNRAKIKYNTVVYLINSQDAKR